LIERPIGLFELHGQAIPPDQNKTIGNFGSFTGFATFGNEPPRRTELKPSATALGFALSTTIRMVDRVSGDTAINWANATMARTPGFAKNHVLVLDVSHLTEGGVAIFMDPSDLTGWKANLGIALVP
jgi:hypothetical protein